MRPLIMVWVTTPLIHSLSQHSCKTCISIFSFAGRFPFKMMYFNNFLVSASNNFLGFFKKTPPFSRILSQKREREQDRTRKNPRPPGRGCERGWENETCTVSCWDGGWYGASSSDYGNGARKITRYHLRVL